jgi:serine/threonine protein phosphatase PrpC
MKTDDEMKDRSFDANFSGTTTVTVMLNGHRLICSNSGDSRAIVCSYYQNYEAGSTYMTGTWVAEPLSRDHKPDLEDEFLRISACNGRVEPFKTPAGDPIGPYRVWLKTSNIPGLAMSRSLGDGLAASVGVIPDPEFYERDLTTDDKFIIVASDGVWEFL